MTDEDKRALRDAFGSFATGVTVVTTRQADGTPRGFTANSFASVSLDPPLLLVCIAKTALSCDIFAAADHFAVNILAEDQKAVSGLFASRAADKFDQSAWHAGPQDVPLLDGVLSSFACARHNLVDAGDHLVLIGRVISFEAAQRQPLGYFRGGYFSIGLEDTLVRAAAEAGNVAIGAVMAQDGKVLLNTAPDGALSIPKADSLSDLIAGLTRAGLTPALGHLYAVFHDNQTGRQSIYYHGSVSGAPPAGMRFHALDDIAWDAVTSPTERSMLTRYRDEFRHGSFGIYQGDQIAGTVHRIAAGPAFTN
ncbi:flavin reductase family protein [Roseovarius sp. M141]|uniref:flavin reductase family protein n=1 Tax=Roseovarius sp. M141 TaxID=2583806 RepID=UPI0020CBC6EE|nr:flavin reductase family protein [Roseovarius sp. M141]MCQ0091608.1 flavin reductase family protein [Roseovarius sp. M141]